MFAILFPNIDPILFSIGQIHIRWYGVAYGIGLLLGIYFIEKLISYRGKKYPQIYKNEDKNFANDLLIYLVIGIVLGGRLGFVFFYHPEWFIERPLHVLNTLEGGMSFHGGLLGVIIGTAIFCKRKKIPFLSTADLICCAAPIGLFFGRCANFINSEHYGRITNVSLGIIFPNSDGMPRHPSQLYEATLEGVILFLICNYLFFFTNNSKKNGFLSGVFLVGYGVSRIFIEYYREPDGYVGCLTIGQTLTLPMLFVGLYLVWYATSFKKNISK